MIVSDVRSDSKAKWVSCVAKPLGSFPYHHVYAVICHLESSSTCLFWGKEFSLMDISYQRRKVKKLQKDFP